MKKTTRQKPTSSPKVIYADLNVFSDWDSHLFKEGTHYHLFEKLGSRLLTLNGLTGVYFAVWAPNAASVSVIGDFNGWNPQEHPLAARWDHSGIWEGFIPGLTNGLVYKYHIVSRDHHYRVDKGDPYAYHWELSPRTASVVWDLAYQWQDEQWQQNRHQKNHLQAPMSIYELHLASWRRKPEENNRLLTYREMAPVLAEYIKKMGFTHVEFMPVMEHPFSGSWGYQIVGYFAPTSRFGTPQDFMYLIDYLHQNEIGVILDWVPSHFPGDQHGLGYFDGTHLYEHADPRQGFHPDWKSYIFNYGRAEVREFLISNALYWLKYYHIDGLRVDGVASILYLDYSRKAGEWIPNMFGGRENLAAIDFLKKFNEVVYGEYPDVQTIAEESTAWPMVTRPTYLGGLGFGLKWNMGWMHDTLKYFAKDPIYRRHHQNDLTFSILYAFTENFALAISHDEVVHGKGSLFGKMPGDDWQKYANLRLLFSYMFTHTGKKMLFMGSEFGQWAEWNHDQSLDWHCLDYQPHQQIQKVVQDLNLLYRTEPALHELDCEDRGFQWIDGSDHQNCVLSYLRKSARTEDQLVVIANLTPVPRYDYKIGVPAAGVWREIFNSDASLYGGSGLGNFGQATTAPTANHGHFQTLSLTLPPLSVLIFKQ